MVSKNKQNYHGFLCCPCPVDSLAPIGNTSMCNSHVGVFHFNLLSLRAKACLTFRWICVGGLTECDCRAGCLTLLRFHLPTLSESAEAFLSNRIEKPVSNDSLLPFLLPSLHGYTGTEYTSCSHSAALFSVNSHSTFCHCCP